MDLINKLRKPRLRKCKVVIKVVVERLQIKYPNIHKKNEYLNFPEQRKSTSSKKLT